MTDVQEMEDSNALATNSASHLVLDFVCERLQLANIEKTLH
jgi:hypothetical protein